MIYLLAVLAMQTAPHAPMSRELSSLLVETVEDICPLYMKSGPLSDDDIQRVEERVESRPDDLARLRNAPAGFEVLFKAEAGVCGLKVISDGSQQPSVPGFVTGLADRGWQFGQASLEGTHTARWFAVRGGYRLDGTIYPDFFAIMTPASPSNDATLGSTK